MSWLRIDDKFAQHPKMLDLSDREFRVHMVALCYCAEYATEGLVPWSSWKTLGVTQRIVDHLVTVGLWDFVEAGYSIHDFKVYNADSLIDRVAAYVESYPQASANDVHRAIGGKREAVLHEVARLKISGSLGTDVEPLRVVPKVVPTRPLPRKTFKSPALEDLVSRDVGHDSRQTRTDRVLLACGLAGNTAAWAKVHRASKGCAEGDVVAAIEAASGPGVRDRLAVALSELKKRKAVA